MGDPTEVFVIFDSQGMYGEPRETEQEVIDWCAKYNLRASDPLKPYRYRRYVIVPDGVTGGSDAR